MMRLFLSVFLGLSVAGAAVADNGNADAFNKPDGLRSLLTPEALESLQAGKTVTEKNVVERDGRRSAGSGAALVLADAPPEKVWAALTDVDGLPEFMPRLVATEQYADGEYVGIRYELRVAWRTVIYHLREIHDVEKLHLAFALDEARENDIESTVGGWLLVPHDGGKQTVIIHAVRADTGMRVPRAIENWLMNRDLPGLVEAVKLRAESGGTYTK